MSCGEPYTRFKGASCYNDYLLLEEIGAGLKRFLNHAFLCIGGYTNVELGDQDYLGTDQSLLTDNSSSSTGVKYTIPEMGIVEESGVYYSGVPTIVPPEVYVDASLVSSGYSINYFEGEVIFSPAVPGSTVTMQYSYHNVLVDTFDSPYMRSLIDHIGSEGVQDQYRKSDIHFPSIGIEVVDKRDFRPYSIGSTAQWVFNDVLFHIYTTTDHEMNFLLDILSYQNDTSFYLLKTKVIAQDGNLDSAYEDLVANTNYRLALARFSKTTIQDKRRINQNLFGGIVRTKLEIPLLSI